MKYKKYEKLVGDELSGSGLFVLGWFNYEASPAMLIGNIGGSHWSAYKKEKHKMGMDEWTQKIIAPIATEMKTKACYPFGKKTYPFQKWAISAMGVNASPLGLLIHEKYGLWFALRAALVFGESFEIPRSARQKSPCQSCSEKPCLKSCPVGAFQKSGYDVESCRNYVRKTPNSCEKYGCEARRSCPVGGYIYSIEQQQFHMSAFL